MWRAMRRLHDRAAAVLSAPLVEGAALLLARLALAGIFWRSGRTKVVEGSWLAVSDTTTFLFAEEYGMPWPEVTGALATYAEHGLAILVALGMFTRVGAAGLLVMTLVIQFFVYPDAWWPTHSLWAALAMILLVRGGGMFAADRLGAARARRT